MRKVPFVKGGFVIVLCLVMIMPASAITIHTSPTTKSASQPAGFTRDVIFEDGFENYTNFTLNFPPWTTIDVDGSPTYGMDYYDWPNETAPQAFIIFNPSATTPPMTGVPDALPHTGDKYAACFNDNNVQKTNDDWIITPRLFGIFDHVTFWAKTFSNQYNLERFQVGVSTTTTDPSAFTIITPSPYIQVPTTWTQYSIDLGHHYGAYYIGIHDVSYDSWFLMIDDFQITGLLGQDTTPPVTNCTLNGTMQGDHYVSHVKVTLTATDDKAGVNITKYQLDGSAWKKYLGTFEVTSEGAHTLNYYSIDNAGNSETQHSISFTIHYPITIAIKGGLGVTVTITNTGTTPYAVDWHVELTGMVFSDNPLSGTTTIPTGGNYIIKDKVIGLGKTTITASTGDLIKTAKGKMWLWFVVGVS